MYSFIRNVDRRTPIEPHRAPTMPLHELQRGCQYYSEQGKTVEGEGYVEGKKFTGLQRRAAVGGKGKGEKKKEVRSGGVFRKGHRCGAQYFIQASSRSWMAGGELTTSLKLGRCEPVQGESLRRTVVRLSPWCGN